MTDITSHSSDGRAVRNVMILIAAQAIVGAQLPMIFTIGGLAGQSLASNICYATLPISMIVLGSMLMSQPMSALMHRFGRRVGFLAGTFGGAVGATVSAVALYYSSFPLLLIGSLLTGIYMSANGFMRFAAADTASDSFRPKAISYVLAGGLMAALIGPQLVKVTAQATPVFFLGSYTVVIGLNLVGAFLFSFLDIPTPDRPREGAPAGRTRLELLRSPRVAVAIICAMVSYALMNLVMTSTPLAVVGCGYGEGAAADVVSAHVLAMFAPSFFTGHLIARFGAEKIVAVGMAILAASGIVAISGVELANFFGALILLGIGWNFGFIGATNMLADSHTIEERGRAQGLNDMIVFGCVTLASLASGGLLNCAGADVVDGWTTVNLTMVPLLMLAGGALIWLVMRQEEQRV